MDDRIQHDHDELHEQLYAPCTDLPNGVTCHRAPGERHLHTAPLPTLPPISADTRELHEINERMEVLLVQRRLAVSDLSDIAGRNDRIDAAEAEMLQLRERSLILSACISIAQATPDNTTKDPR